MDINDMKLGDLKTIAAMFQNAQAPTPIAPNPFIGQYVICRCYAAGVHAGVLVSQSGDEVVLEETRRIWSWKAKAGVALSGLAKHGLQSGKIDVLLEAIFLTGVAEIIPCTPAARTSIDEA